MSFINMMANDVWSDSDITNRTEAMIASEFSSVKLAILNRKATGAALGQYQLNAEEASEITRYAELSESARLAGVKAKADMELLLEVFKLEAANARLALDPSTVPDSEIAADIEDRRTAQAVVDTASAEAKAIVLLRNPIPTSSEKSLLDKPE